jgi:hypothetical protein
MKTSANKLPNSGYLSRFEPKPVALILGKFRLLSMDSKGVHKPGQVSTDEVPGLFATRLLVISIQAINTGPEIAAVTRESRALTESADTP